MAQTGPVAYATVAQLMGANAYMRDPNSTINTAIATTLLNVASRFIDEKCGRVFYNDGSYLRFFDGQARREVTLELDFFGKIGTIAAASKGATTLTFTSAPVGGGPAPVNGDVLALDIGAGYEQVTISNVTGGGPYTLTVGATAFAHPASTIASTIIPKFAFYENQPLSQWLTMQGDGVTAGSTNWLLWPTNPKLPVATGFTAQVPWQGFNMPLIPVSNTTYLPTPRPGTATIAVTANWGWPTVPDLIVNLTLKMAARAWQSRQAGWAQSSGDSSVGVIDMSHHFDSTDEELLTSSGFVRWAF